VTRRTLRRGDAGGIEEDEQTLQIDLYLVHE
jgi:hypothetical protein